MQNLPISGYNHPLPLTFEEEMKIDVVSSEMTLRKGYLCSEANLEVEVEPSVGLTSVGVVDRTIVGVTGSVSACSRLETPLRETFISGI